MLLIGGGVLVSLLLVQASTALGVLFLAVSLMGAVVLFLERNLTREDAITNTVIMPLQAKHRAK